MDLNWYEIKNIDALDTPSLAMYGDRVNDNIETLIRMIGDVSRLRPHVKTHKSSEVCHLLLDAGITKFKCATIAEAEMLAAAGALDVLLAYQPVGPKNQRLAALVDQYSNTTFSCLIDNINTARVTSHVFGEMGIRMPIFIDLNVGMNRTGLKPADVPALFENCAGLPGLKVVGLHAYDGHIRDADFEMRKEKCDVAFQEVSGLRQQLQAKTDQALTIVVGGSPTYSVHCKRQEVECSPGTFIYWDYGYQNILKEQDFKPAALVITRIISQPTPDTICIDLGHKAIASENPLANRVHFIGDHSLEPIGHSEEHMVLRTTGNKHYYVGEVLYGIPYHVCPTVALYDSSVVVSNNELVGTWDATARGRRLAI
jgi:D-serine deaminase-like pyridoxal phosphate-dependent protein